jgi:DNA-binding CsgD family transcriptional regulator/PAS domain-containing protein
VKELDQLIGLIYEAALEPERWPACLTMLGEVLRAPAIGLFPFSPGSLATRASVCVGHDPAFLARYDAYYGRPDVNAYTRAAPSDLLAPGVVVRAEAIIPDRELRRTEYYADWLRPQGIGAGGFAIVRAPGEPLVLSVARSPSLGHLGTDELAAVCALVPHLERSLAVGSRLERLAGERGACEDALDALDVAVILVDRAGKPVFLNHGARALLAADDGLGHDREGLRGATPEATAALRRSVAEAGRGGLGATGRALGLPRPSGRRPLAALVTPVGPGRWRGAPDAACAAVLVSDPESTPAPPAMMLRRLWGLTGAEAVLTHQLLLGLSPKEAAERLGVTVATVRSQLSEVFSKTGTGRQGDLVRLVASTLAGLRLPVT